MQCNSAMFLILASSQGLAVSLAVWMALFGWIMGFAVTKEG